MATPKESPGAKSANQFKQWGGVPIKHYIVGVTGASGSIYGIRLIQELCKRHYKVDVLLSKAARQVIRQELELDLSGTLEQQRKALEQMVGVEDGLYLYEEDDWFSPVASGSSRRDGMIVIPCSMGTLSAVAVGASDTLLERAADVCLKEGRKLILVPRETPYSTIHLRNMLTLSEMGVKILPASPAFYHQPHSVMDLVDFVVSRVLDQLDISNDLIQRWEGKE